MRVRWRLFLLWAVFLFSGCSDESNAELGTGSTDATADAASDVRGDTDHTPPNCVGGCLIGGICVPDDFADPGNVCHRCDAGAAGHAWTDNDGASCDDDLFCTVDDICTAGICAGVTRDCSDGIACNGNESCDDTIDSCIAGENLCSDGTICDAATGDCVRTCAGCTIDDVCYGDSQVNPLETCLVCAAAHPDTWSTNDGAPCDDGNFCNGTDLCAEGVCSVHSGDPCSDAHLCVEDDQGCCLRNVPVEALTCNSDGDVVSVDECGDEFVVEDCVDADSNGACVDGRCGCAAGWSGASCDQRCVVYVDGQTGDDGNSGASWLEAVRTVNVGIGRAVAFSSVGGFEGCWVWVKAGTYEEQVTLLAGVEVYGGFAGDELALEERSINDNVTILTVTEGVVVICDGADGCDDDARLDGFTVTGGTNSGIRILDASPTLAFCTIDNNSAPHGGGMFLQNSSSRITDCTLTGNSAYDGDAGLDGFRRTEGCFGSTWAWDGTNGQNGGTGGGLYLDNGAPELVRCTFHENAGGGGGSGGSGRDGSNGRNAEFGPAGYGECGGAGGDGGDGGRGGAVFVNAGFPTFTECVFSKNRAGAGGVGGDGGKGGHGGDGLDAIYSSGSFSIAGSGGDGGVAGSGGNGGSGGGLFIARGFATLTKCQALENTAGAAGHGGNGGAGGTSGSCVLYISAPPTEECWYLETWPGGSEWRSWCTAACGVAQRGHGGRGGQGGAGGQGGGVSLTGGALSVTETLLWANTAGVPGHGGQGGNGGASLNGYRSGVDSAGNGGNGGPGGQSGRGGGVFASDAPVTLSNCALFSNFAPEGGNGGAGGRGGDGGDYRGDNRSIHPGGAGGNGGNGGDGGAGGSGGGLYFSNSTVQLTNCTLTQNGSGGGGSSGSGNSYGEGGHSENGSGDDGQVGVNGEPGLDGPGGVFNENSSTTVINTIIWDNCYGGSDSDQIVSTGTEPVVTFSAVGGDIEGENNIEGDPKLLLFYGLRLDETSPCIDAGNNDAVTGLETDLRGAPRIMNGTVDMGAYEGGVTREECLGQFRECPATSCAEVFAARDDAMDGIYWLDTGDEEPFETYCDMTTAGGGWTLVAVYALADRPTVFSGSAYPRPGASFYGLAAADEMLDGDGNLAVDWNFSIDGAALWNGSRREVMAYVGGVTDDYITATLPEGCNFFEASTSCSENTYGPFDVVLSDGMTLTENGYACTALRTDSYDEFGLHILDGLDVHDGLACHHTASTLGHQGIGRLFTTFESSTVMDYWSSGVHSYWDDEGAENQPGALYVR